MKQIVLFSLVAVCCMQAEAQTFFSERSLNIGVNHFFLSGEPMGGGVAWFDYNNDGEEDMWITAGANRDVLYKNNGNGTFTEVGGTAGISVTDNFVTNGVTTADIDNDGDRDVFVTTSKGFHNLLFRNNGDGTFTDITDDAGVKGTKSWSTVATFGDINLDGYLDLYVGNYVNFSVPLIDSATMKPYGFAHDCFPNYLYLNEGPSANGDVTFKRIDATAQVADTGCALAVAFTDYDNDRDIDLFLVNDFGEWIVPNRLYQNNPPSQTFAEVSQAAGMDAQMYGMGIAIGDYDQDRDLDYYVTNLGRNGLFENQGNGSFSDVTATAGVEDTYMGSQLSVGWGTTFADIDNDTDLDLFVTNGYVPAFEFIATSTLNYDRLFLNKGDQTFDEVGNASGVADPSRGRGSACADYDKDGDVDWVVVPVNKVASGDPIEKVLVYRNNLNNTSHWLKVKLQGTINNRDAFGSHIEIVLSDRSWRHEVSGGSSHGSQNSSIAHFGLGTAQTVDSLIVSWPGGKKQILTQVAADQFLTIVEDTSLYTTHILADKSPLLNLKVGPNPFQDEIQVTFSLSATEMVEIDLVNALGEIVSKHVSGILPPGNHHLTIEGKDTSGNPLSPGLYILRVKAGEKVGTKKVYVVQP